MVAANIWFGIDTTYTVDLAQAAATALIDALPAQTPTVLGALQ
jgi:hypothetical protein